MPYTKDRAQDIGFFLCDFVLLKGKILYTIGRIYIFSFSLIFDESDFMKKSNYY